MRDVLLLAFVAFASACGASAPSPRPAHGGDEQAAGAAHGRAEPTASAHHDHRGYHHDFSDVDRFARRFDDPERARWQQPEQVVALLELEPGMNVADIGTGTGYFLPHLSPAVGPRGKVLALDVEPAMIEHVRERAREAGLENVEARVVSPGDPGLEPGSVDRVLIVDTWHHIDDREDYARRLRDALVPGGFVLVVDFTADSPHGPPAEARLTPETVAAELSAGGLEAEIVPEPLPYQYVVRGRRAAP